MDTSLSDINAYILTGGQSRRLNADKSLELLNGRTLTEIIHKKLSTIFNNIYVVGKENHFQNYNFMEDIKPVQCPLEDEEQFLNINYPEELEKAEKLLRMENN